MVVRLFDSVKQAFGDSFRVPGSMGESAESTEIRKCQAAKTDEDCSEKENVPGFG